VSTKRPIRGADVWAQSQCQKRPTSVKRDLLQWAQSQCQKRPTSVKRDLLQWAHSQTHSVRGKSETVPFIMTLNGIYINTLGHLIF